MVRPTSSEQPEPRVALVRHGRSAHVHTGWIDGDGFRAWRAAYEAAGIRESERVPADLKRVAAQADLVLASDAPRAVSSARLMAPARDIVVSPLLRELDLEGPHLRGLRLPLAAWALAVGGRSLLTSLRGQYPSPAETARIAEAAAWLGALASEHSLIVGVTHASFRERLARQLVRTGWQAEPGSRSSRHWSAWLFKRPATPQ